MNWRGAIRRLRLPAFVIALFWIGCAAAGAAYSAEIDVHGAVESFVWKEFDSERLLKESGVLTGAGVSYHKELSDRLILDESADIFGGRVGYDGTAQQTGAPTTSTVDYFVLKLKGDVGRSFRVAEKYALEPFAGLGSRLWFRRIRNGITSTGRPVQGYTEQWTTFYARLGARGGMEISQSRSLFAEAGVKFPLYNENTAYFSREGIGSDKTMHPGGQVSLFAEAGLRTGDVKVSLFYDGLRFSRSPDVDAVGTHQPRSTADIFGVSISVLLF